MHRFSLFSFTVQKTHPGQEVSVVRPQRERSRGKKIIGHRDTIEREHRYQRPNAGQRTSAP